MIDGLQGVLEGKIYGGGDNFFPFVAAYLKSSLEFQ